MRYICGNIDGKALGLKSEAYNVLEVIGKCSRGENAKGWYASMQALADILPFQISRMTVDRAVEKLITLGLIERRENGSLYIAQNEQPNAQIEQNSTPLNNPPIINNKNKETSEMKTDFEKFFDKFSAEYRNRFAATQLLWDHRSKVAQDAMWDELKEERDFTVDRNPYFFVQNFPEPQPEWLSGGESGDLVQVKYNGLHKICTRATMERFGLEWVRDW